MSESEAPTKRGKRGLGTAYQDERGRWRKQVSLGVDLDTGKRRRVTFYGATLEECLEKERDAIKQSNTAKATSSSGTVGAWMDYWIENIAPSRVRPTTLLSYQRHLIGMAKPKIGHIKMKKLEVAHVRKMRDDLVKEHPEGKTRNARMTLTVLSCCLGDAMREGKLSQNVAEGRMVSRPPDNKTAGTSPTAAQAKQILKTGLANDDRYVTRWATALMIGPRQGECLGLTWDRVDVDKAEIELSWQLQTLPTVHGCTDDQKSPKCGKKRPYQCSHVQLKTPPHGFEYKRVQNTLYLTRPKTARSKRRLPIPPELAQMFKIHRELTKHEPNPHNLVWHEPDGKAITITDDTNRWKEACAAAGLPHFKLHSARHTTATLLKSMGVDQRVIMHLLGHTSEDTTSIYAEITDDVGREAVSKMSSLLQLD